MSSERLPQGDKELWRSLAADPAVASGSVSDLDFAAWLEGRLPERDAARVEAAIAADPELRRAALELADVLGHALPASPARLEVRAKALVGFAVERSADRLGLLDWMFIRDRRFVVQRAMTIAAAAAIAASGFMLGGGLGASMAQERYAGVSRTTTDASSDLNEFSNSDGI